MAKRIEFEYIASQTLTLNIYKNGSLTHTDYSFPQVISGYYGVDWPDQTSGDYYARIKSGSAIIGYDTWSNAGASNQPIPISGIVGSSPTASSFTCSTLSATDDFYNGSVLTFTSGSLLGIARKISNYIGSSKTLEFAFAFPTAPTAADTFLILGRIE